MKWRGWHVVSSPSKLSRGRPSPAVKNAPVGAPWAPRPPGHGVDRAVASLRLWTANSTKCPSRWSFRGRRISHTSDCGTTAGSQAVVLTHFHRPTATTSRAIRSAILRGAVLLPTNSTYLGRRPRLLPKPGRTGKDDPGRASAPSHAGAKARVGAVRAKVCVREPKKLWNPGESPALSAANIVADVERLEREFANSQEARA